MTSPATSAEPDNRARAPRRFRVKQPAGICVRAASSGRVRIGDVGRPFPLTLRGGEAGEFITVSAVIVRRSVAADACCNDIICIEAGSAVQCDFGDDAISISIGGGMP